MEDIHIGQCLHRSDCHKVGTTGDDILVAAVLECDLTGSLFAESTVHDGQFEAELLRELHGTTDSLLGNEAVGPSGNIKD